MVDRIAHAPYATREGVARCACAPRPFVSRRAAGASMRAASFPFDWGEFLKTPVPPASSADRSVGRVLLLIGRGRVRARPSGQTPDALSGCLLDLRRVDG